MFFIESMKTNVNDFVECLAFSDKSAVVMTGVFTDYYEIGKVSLFLYYFADNKNYFYSCSF